MSLQRKIGAPQLWAIAVGMVISGQYFGWNFGFTAGGLYGLIIAAFMVTVFYLCFMFSYAELTTAIPHAGGAMAYAYKAFGPLLGYISGIACLLEFTFAPPAIAVAIGSYVHFLFPFIAAHAATIAAFIICIMINLSGTKNVAWFEFIVTITALFGLLFYYAFGLAKVNISHLSGGQHFLPHGISGIFAAIPFAIWLYLGIEGGAMAAEEVREPHKDISKGFIMAILTLTACSFFTIFITVGLDGTMRSVTDHPLPYALLLAYPFHQWLSYLIDILGLFGLFASLNGLIIGYSRQAYALARAGYLPRLLANLSRQNVPHWALIIPGIFGIIVAGSASFSNSLIILAVFAATLTYFISLLALFKLRKTNKALYRPFKVFYPIVPFIAIILGMVCLASVFYYAILNNKLHIFIYEIPLLAVLACIIVIATIYFFYRRHRQGIFNLDKK